jgi:guanine nucleotide-binding protein subunit alpha, other
MCFGGRDKGDVDLARSREIDKVIKQDEKRLAKEVKLLLLGMSRPGPGRRFVVYGVRRMASPMVFSLRCYMHQSLIEPCADSAVLPTGAGESGKSTILKQMKLIYSQGFSDHEKLEWKPVIFSNIVQSFKTIAEAMSELSIEFEKPENEVSPLYPRRPASYFPSCCHLHFVAWSLVNDLLDIAPGAEVANWRCQKHMAHILVDREISADEQLPQDYLVPIKSLWQDKGVIAAIAKGNEYALHDNLD